MMNSGIIFFNKQLLFKGRGLLMSREKPHLTSDAVYSGPFAMEVSFICVPKKRKKKKPKKKVLAVKGSLYLCENLKNLKI